MDRNYQDRMLRTQPGRRYYPPTESDIPMHGWSPYHFVHRERVAAHEKHADKPGGSMEMKCFDNESWSDVLMEEMGEVSRVRNDLRHGLHTPLEAKSLLRAELIQVAAMACAWIQAIDLDQRVLGE